MTESAGPGDVTRLLRAWSDGDESALSELVPLVEAELRRRARAYFDQERRDHTLQPTALINEAYMRIADTSQLSFSDREHFFAFAARTMRRVLVDHARARNARKRGPGQTVVLLDDEPDPRQDDHVDLISLHEALEALSAVDEDLARVVDLRHFAGLDVAETARVMDVSPATVKRKWSTAKAWLYERLSEGPG